MASLARLLQLEKKLAADSRPGRQRQGGAAHPDVGRDPLTRHGLRLRGAAFVAIGSGDIESYRQLCGIGLSRFAAGAEGISATHLASMLLAAPRTPWSFTRPGDLVGRVEQARRLFKGMERWACASWLGFPPGAPGRSGGSVAQGGQPACTDVPHRGPHQQVGLPAGTDRLPKRPSSGPAWGVPTRRGRRMRRESNTSGRRLPPISLVIWERAMNAGT